MVKTLIKQHLNTFVKAKEKGIGIGRYAEIRPELRGRISDIQNQTDLSSSSWNVILKSDVMLDFINKNTTVSNDAIESVTQSQRKQSEIEQAIQFNELDSAYKEVKESVKEHKQGYYYHRSSNLRTSDVLVDVVLYSSKYGYDPSKAYSAAKTIAELYNNSKLEKFLDLGEERVDYLDFVQMSYTQQLSDSVGHFKSQKGHFEFYQFVYDKISNSHVFKSLYKPIKTAVKESHDPEQTKELIKEIFNHSQGVKWLTELCPTPKDILLDREIRTLSKAEDKEIDAYALVYGEDSPQYKIFSSIKSDDFHYLRIYAKKCMKNKKKAFIRLLSENIETYKELGEYSVLFRNDFNKMVNVNTLNQSNLNVLSKMYDDNKMKNLREDVSLTFQEFELLYTQNDKIDIDLYYQLTDLSVDARLRICRELPGLQPLLDNFEYDELLTKVARLVRVKPMKKWLADNNINIKDGTDEQKLYVLLAPEKFEKFQHEIKSGADIKFIVKNHALMKYAATLDQAKVLYISEDEDCKFMLEDMNLSGEFLKDNKSNIVSFCERGLATVYATIHRHGRLSSAQLKNLRLITKAELAGKLEDIKFVDEDFELEIGLPISETVKSEWKSNRRVKASGFTITEAYDYETTIKMGENPVRSCLSWNNGSYSRCLLSHFDTNKKLLIAKDRKGRVLARASLRLTKGSEQFIELQNEFKAKSLSFKDIDETGEEVEQVNKEVTEELVLFLEKCYTSLDGSQAEIVRGKFIEMAREKAAELGARLVLADDYSSDIPYDDNTLVSRKYYIFISYSKNGYQYLDSISGQASESNEGHYRKAEVYVQQSNALTQFSA